MLNQDPDTGYSENQIDRDTVEVTIKIFNMEAILNFKSEICIAVEQG